MPKNDIQSKCAKCNSDIQINLKKKMTYVVVGSLIIIFGINGIALLVYERVVNKSIFEIIVTIFTMICVYIYLMKIRQFDIECK